MNTKKKWTNQEIYWFPIIIGIVTMVALYTIGFITKVEFLTFEPTESNLKFSTFPIGICLLVYLVLKNIMKMQNKKLTNKLTK